SNLGQLELAGTVGNSFTGGVRVSEGQLVLNKSAGAAIPSGTLVVGSGPDNLLVAGVLYQQSNQLTALVNVVINSDAEMNLINRSDTIGSLTMMGGHLDTGAGTLTLNGDVTADALDSTEAVIAGNLDLGTATRTFNIGNTGGGLQIFAAISGAAGVGLT